MKMDPSGAGFADVSQRVGRVVAEDERVRFVYLFGSRASGRPQSSSDTDLAVWIDLPLSFREVAVLQDGLAAALGDVDLLVLNDAALWLQFRVLGEGVVVFSRDERARIRFRERVEKHFLDFRHLHDAYLAAVRDRARAGTLSRG